MMGFRKAICSFNSKLWKCSFPSSAIGLDLAEPFDLFALILHLGDTHKDDPCEIVSTPGCFMLTHRTSSIFVPCRRPIRLSARAAASPSTKVLRSTLWYYYTGALSFIRLFHRWMSHPPWELNGTQESGRSYWKQAWRVSCGKKGSVHTAPCVSATHWLKETFIPLTKKPYFKAFYTTDLNS